MPDESGFDENITCVVVGDAQSGKTSLITTYARLNNVPIDESAQKFQNYAMVDIDVDGMKNSLTLSDTESSDQFSRFRALNYEEADVFVIVFSVTSKVFVLAVIFQTYQLRNLSKTLPSSGLKNLTSHAQMFQSCWLVRKLICVMSMINPTSKQDKVKCWQKKLMLLVMLNFQQNNLQL